MHRKRARRILWDLKKVSWVESCRPKKKGDFRLLAEASWRVPHVLGRGTDGKASIEILCLSPYVEKPLNSKVIKSFVPELRSRKCFSCFGIPMSYIIYVIYIWTLWTFCVPVWICLFHIFISGYVTVVCVVSGHCNQSFSSLFYVIFESSYWYICCILTFDPAKHAISKWCAGRKWHIPIASNRKRSRGRIWLMKWDKVKIPWYTHRLMYRKKMTSELHDSYFRLMTIKHAIPKIEWAIEWALNYYITRSRPEVRQLGSREVADEMW